MGGEQSPHGNGLIDAGEAVTGEIGIELHLLCGFGGGADRSHFSHSFKRVFAGGGLGAGHDGIGAVENRIGHIADLGPGGHGVVDHALHHLGGGDGDFVVL